MLLPKGTVSVDEPGRTYLKDLLVGKAADLHLDYAALSLATIEFPGLAISSCLEMLDAYAGEVARHTSHAANGREFIFGANQFLFHELGLRGNAEDYYNPHNSCLNEVLTQRVGIPITLSVLYMEIARRLEKPVFGIGLPGHFIVQYDDGHYSTFLDPFHGGALLTPEQCYEMAQVNGNDPRVLLPVDKRQILFRMINNLRGIYFSRRAYNKALQVMDLLIDASPGIAEHYKQRGLVYLQMKQMRAARADLQRYLEISPEAADRAEMEKQLLSIVRWMATLN